MFAKGRRSRAYRPAILALAVSLWALAGAANAQSEKPSLFDAAQRGDLSTVNALLMSGADVNAGRSTGYTALFIASQNGHLEVVRALLAAKADPNTSTDVGGRTPLTRALASGHADVALALIEGGADVHARSMGGVTPLMLAAGSDNLAIVNKMLAAGADVDAGTPPRFGTGSCAAPANASAGTTMSAINPAYWAGTCYYSAIGTALGRAAAGGSADIVQALLAAKAAVDARQLNGNTPLTIASAKGRADVVRILLAAKADIGAADDNGHSALMLASANGHVDVVRILLAAKADVNAKARDGSTALMLAMYKDRAEVAQRQQRAVVAALSPTGTASQRAVSTRRRDVVQALLAADADASARDNSGNTPLTLAEQNGHNEIAALLRSATGAVPSEN
jgi:ankyrin repeat protein